MGLRLSLHLKLVEASETENVYFQPLPNITMKYPCVVYQRSKEDAKYANNQLYAHTKGYTVTYISQDPDSLAPDRIRHLPLCRFAQHFVADNLNHDVYDLYF